MHRRLRCNAHSSKQVHNARHILCEAGRSLAIGVRKVHTSRCMHLHFQVFSPQTQIPVSSRSCRASTHIALHTDAVHDAHAVKRHEAHAPLLRVRLETRLHEAVKVLREGALVRRRRRWRRWRRRRDAVTLNIVGGDALPDPGVSRRACSDMRGHQ